MSIRGTARLLVEKTFIQRYVDTLSGSNKGSDMLNEFIADEQLRQSIGTIEAAFPHFEMSVEDLFGEQDKVVVRGTMRGVHRGELMGIAPTQKHAAMAFTVILRISGGKIVEHWPSADLFGLLQQLGASQARLRTRSYLING
jgi:predicted ester cyclase